MSIGFRDNSLDPCDDVERIMEMLTLNALTDGKFLEALKATPVGRQAAERSVEAEIAGRKRLVDDIAALDARSAAAWPKLLKAEAEAIDAAQAVERTLRAASDKVGAAAAARSLAAATYTAERARLEQALRDSADGEEIDRFARSMRDEMDATRRSHTGGQVRERDFHGNVALRGFTNWTSVSARLEAIKTAIEEAERLRLQPDQRHVRARLSELRASLPAIGEVVYAPPLPGKAAAA